MAPVSRCPRRSVSVCSWRRAGRGEPASRRLCSKASSLPRRRSRLRWARTRRCSSSSRRWDCSRNWAPGCLSRVRRWDSWILASLSLRRINLTRLVSSACSRCSHSRWSGLSISAAAEGVGARRSATMSAMLKSTSCPTAATTGSSLAAMARATISSLKAHRSSREPPPRPTSRASKCTLPSRCQRLARSMAAAIWRAASSPCTATGSRETAMPGQRRRNTVSMS